MCKNWSKREESRCSTKYLSNELYTNEISPTENKQLVTSGRLGHKWWGCSSGSLHLQQSPASKTKYWSSFNMMTLVWLLAIAGLLVALIVYEFFSRQHYQQYKDMLAYMCDERARMLQYQFSVSMNHVHALSILVSMFYLGKHSTVLDQNIFAEYTAKTGFERPLMSGVAYAHRVLHFEREEFEKAQGWTIKTMHSKEPSPAYDEYAPIIFSEETIGYIVSLDMMSGEEDRENILRARATGKGVLTSPFRLLKSNHLGVVLTFAVYNKELPLDATVEERIEAAVGYLGGPFDVESLVDILLVQLAKSEDIIVNVYDVTNISNPLIMYGDDATGYGFSHVSSLDFGDPYRKHQMYCSLARKIPRSTLAVGFAAGVLAFVTLICAMVYNAHKHVKKVEEDYRKMEELKVQAEAADIAKSQFLATVSHEIRTPMNGVLGMLQMLLDTQLNATQQDFARTAQASGKALINLINEVLDQAKIESGRIELEAVPFDLRAILDDVLSLFSGKTRDEGIELAIYVSERVPHILIGDPGRIRQVITNLVGNSVKFTEKGHIFVCVHRFEDIESVKMANVEAMAKFTAEFQLANNHNSMLSSSLSGHITANSESSWDFFQLLLAKEKHRASENESSEIKLFISVEDTGIGIPSHAQDRIFTPFMQADSSMSRTYGGTGIGLSISRCLVDLMKGEMWFVSKENVGSTFSFSCELSIGDEQVGEDKSFLNDRVLVNNFKGIKILVIDGREVRLEVARNHLQRLGLQVYCVSDFELTVKVLSGAPPSGVASFTLYDLVLVEKDAWGPSSGLKLPLSLFSSNQDTKESSGPKMILMANSMTSTECETAKRMGYIDTIIMKPLRATMIAACLQEVLGMGNRNQQEKEKQGNLRNLLYGKQILVVDDNKVNRIVAAGALKKYGAHVECADSGKVAISMLRPPHRFDACFMDIQMPEMDGFEATRHIRLAEKLANSEGKSEKGGGPIKVWHVPILAMTADVIQATYEECVRCKMDGYVSKPFEEEQLYIAVNQVLTMPAS